MVCLESPDLEVPPELVLLADLEGDQIKLELCPAHAVVHLEQPLDQVLEARRDEDGRCAHPQELPRGDIDREAPDVVEVSMGEERGRTGERKSRAWGEVAARSQSREVEGGKDRENRI